MSFLSATLLLGTLAAGVPIVLHLLARQPPRRVVFPAVRFLQRHLSTQTSRLKVRRWWLLGLRILALLALAIVLARPHIDSKMSSQWTTVGLIGLAGLGLLAMASVALARGLGRSLAWSLLAAALLTMLIAGLGALRAIASGSVPELRIEQPLALAILIDNSPSSAWQVREDVSSDSIFDEENASGSRLAVAITRAGELISHLPSGSRVAILDRSASPAGFSLDDTAAQARLARITARAAPAPIADRIASAVELVRTSDLPNRHVLVVSDMAAPTWQEGLPNSSARSPLTIAKRESIPVSVLNIHESATLAADSGAGMDTDDSDPALNSWLSLPHLADAAPPPGVAIPIRIELGVDSVSPNGGEEIPGADPGSPTPLTSSVQLSLYERDPALPVVRDGNIVLPPLRSVDRVAVDLPDLSQAATVEVLLTLPPLERGTYHAVIQLAGADRFAWDNHRYVTIDLPTPPHVLIVGSDRDETQVLAAAMTAPHAPDGPMASYRIETVSYVDVGAVDWKKFQMVVLIDPPLHVGGGSGERRAPEDTLSTTIVDELADLVKRGGGLLVSLGPSVEFDGSRPVTGSETPGAGDAESRGVALLPPIIRSWRIPSPGTYWRVLKGSHPIFDSLMSPSSMPNWADFRITRYLQVGEPSDWEVLARYASASGGDQTDAGGSAHAAMLTRTLGTGRVVVTTTPLPALGPKTRTWNDLFAASDAWPAFMTVRGVAAWLAGVDRQNLTIQTGQTGIIHLGTNTNADETSDSESPVEIQLGDEGTGENERVLQLYAPGKITTRPIPWTDATVVVGDVETPGTYFLRAPQVWTGVSANLPPKWSRGKTASRDSLEKWFGEEGWTITRRVNSLSLGGGEGSAAAVSLHAPLMLLAVLVFLAEQVLSNRFYGSTRDPGAP